MFRKACLIVAFLCITGTCFASDLRIEGARDYIFGFLAGDGDVYSGSMAIKDDLLFVLRRIAYPLSSWSWAQSVIEGEALKGDSVVLEVVRPDISTFFSGKRPEVVEEWAGFLSVLRQPPEMKQKKEEIMLKVSSLGEVEISQETKKAMLDKVTEDIITGIKWCKEHSDLAPKEYVISVNSEINHGLMPVPSEISVELEGAVKILTEGDKK